MDWLRQLRNEVYHDAYVPTLPEADRALRAAEACAQLLF
jgi:hypothetical protein